MRLLFARHGESEANLRRELANRGSSYGLTAAGRAQAASLAESLRSESVTSIFSSPLRRAVETSEIVGQALRVLVVLDEALREYDCGVYEGRSDEAAWSAYDAVQAQWLDHGQPDARMEGGESLADMRARFVPFVRGLVAVAAPDDVLVLVGHGGLYRCLLPELLTGIDPHVARDRGVGHAQFVEAMAEPNGLLTCAHWPG